LKYKRRHNRRALRSLKATFHANSVAKLAAICLLALDSLAFMGRRNNDKNQQTAKGGSLL